jgi:hypothetical protein
MNWQVTIEPVKEKSFNPAFDIPETRQFPAGADAITLGRETTSDVVFPAGARIVSSTHGRLRKQPSGDYVLESFGDHYFEVNGTPADQNQPLHDGDVIRLGDKKGPAIRVRLAKGPRTDGLLSTLRNAPNLPVHERMRLIRKLVAGVAAAVAVVALVTAGALYWIYQRTGDFEKQLATYQKEMADRARSQIPDPGPLLAATYAVIVKDGGLEPVKGTAWAYKPGMLVTNAHVAALFKPGTLVVRKPAGGPEIPVTGVLIHPGYTKFGNFTDEASADGPNGLKAMTAGKAMPSGYDVAILQVDPAADISPTLDIADDPGASLKPGVALAAAGFPIEGTAAQQLAQLGADATVQFGFVTSLSDYFLLHTSADHTFLVQHSVPASGGASGSPIIDGSGKVVAILSGGNIAKTEDGRTANAVMINYAQRADLVRGIVDQQNFDLAGEEAHWAEVVPRFNQHKTAVLADAVHSLEQASGATAVEQPPISGSFRSGRAVKAGPMIYREHQVQVVAGQSYRFVAYGDPHNSLSLVLFRGGEGIQNGYGGRWFPMLDYTADRDETLTLRVVGDGNAPPDAAAYELTVLSAPKAVAAN